MENTEDISAFESAMQGPKRPQFLTVLCVLSFVWCGISVLLGIWSMIRNTPENMAESIEQMRSVYPQMADQMEQQMLEMQESTYMQISPYLNFVYILLSFLGVLMMWKLNKNGFFIYLAGELIPYTGFILAGKQMSAMMSGGGMMKEVGLIMTILMVVFDIVFFVMYGMNLKHMTGENPK